MRRSICSCEPGATFAGKTSTWKFIYTTATQLPKGTKIRFDLASSGGPLDWQIPQTNLKKKENLIWAEIDGKQLPATELEVPQKTQPSYEFTLSQELKTGDSITIFIGTPESDKPEKGNTCQKTVQRKRPFHLFIDPKGKGDYKEAEMFHLDIRGNHLKSIRVIAPSLVHRNKRFDVIVRFEDMYGNLTSNAPEGTLIDLSYEHLRENLNWKLFIPETGFIALPNLYFNEPGIYKIQLRNTKTKDVFFSPPIKCLADPGLNLYWGMLHSESDRMTSKENIETLLRHVRDDKALQFFATSCFENEEETSNDFWKSIVQQITEFNEEDRFVAILGFQWMGDPEIEGMRHFIYTKDAKPILRRKDSKNNSLKKIFKTNHPKEMISIPVLTMGKETCYNFDDFNPEFEKVVEIYNAWGSSECTAKEGNKYPIAGGRQAISESSEGSLTRALNKGHRFGFVAGGLDFRGYYQNLVSAGNTQYSPGLTAILAKEHTRASIGDALQNRSCYATTGERIVLGFHIAGYSMGSEIDTKTRPGLEFNRHITGYAIGTCPLTEVAIIRNGKVFKTLKTTDEKIDIMLDDSDLLGSISIHPNPNQSPFAYYFLRVTQSDGHTAWSSPIWVDLNAQSAAINGVSKKLKKKTSSSE